MKILLLTDRYEYAIGNIFASTLKEIGHEVKIFDLLTAINKYVRLGKVGRVMQSFIPLEAWIKKGNRELAVVIKEFKPDQIIISGHVQVNYGTIAFAKSILPELKVTQFWPDSFINMTQVQLNLINIVDKLVSYSNVSLRIFQQLGFKHVEWMPFAGDINFLGSSDNSNIDFRYDVTFIGAWRPEREKIIVAAIKNIPDLRYKVVGPYWKRNLNRKEISKYVEDTSILGRAYGDLIRSSRINLNIIDDTNYPAANMRFFEVPVAGGLQLCSPCPEQENIFVDGKHIFYFQDEISVCEKIAFMMRNETISANVRKNGKEKAIKEHTYFQRVEKLLS